MKGDIITYDYYGSLYINMTNRCDCHCVFCIRDQDASALGGLWLQEEPTKEAVLEEILAHDLTPYAEIVFLRLRGAHLPGRRSVLDLRPAPRRRPGRPAPPSG